ncbi:MAG: hypothetical protein ACFFDN_03235 [Candidatus Hodarchaeota archaeon]
MSIILRIDVDRPYGKHSLFHHILSRISSDLYFPRIEAFKYLSDLNIILRLLNQNNIRSYIFFRRCTLPSPSILKLMNEGNHLIGLHLENSSTFETFNNELMNFEAYLGRKIKAFSKHGSGKYKYGLHHYVPYESKKYIEWGKKANMHIFFGNYEDPTITDYIDNGLHIFPSAFWLEPFWRNTGKFNIEWLKNEAYKRNIVLLFHPDNITVDIRLFNELSFILKNIPTKIFN